MSKYIKYLKYLLEHKKNVFKICWRKGQYIHAFTHDLSKFSPQEFIPYARWFYGEYGVNYQCSLEDEENSLVRHNKLKQEFEEAWEHHQLRNKHHFNYWTYDIDKYYNIPFIGLKDCKLQTPRLMPAKYIKQMIIDWQAMSVKFGDTPQQYYLEHYHEIELNVQSRVCLEWNLGLTNMLNASFSEGNWEVWSPLVEIVKEYSKTEYGTHILRDELFIKIDQEYNVNTYELLTKTRKDD